MTFTTARRNLNGIYLIVSALLNFAPLSERQLHVASAGPIFASAHAGYFTALYLSHGKYQACLPRMRHSLPRKPRTIRLHAVPPSPRTRQRLLRNAPQLHAPRSFIPRPVVRRTPVHAGALSLSIRPSEYVRRPTLVVSTPAHAPPAPNAGTRARRSQCAHTVP
jgi:hypothetical protein